MTNRINWWPNNNIGMENKIVKQLNRHYFVSLTLLILFFVLLFFKIIQLVDTPMEMAVSVETYTIMITLVTIPLVLKMFANRLKKIKSSELEQAQKISQYKTIYFMRLYAIVTVTAGNIVLYGLSRNHNFFWLMVVLLIVFVFCRSSEAEVLSVIEKQENKEPTPENIEQ